MTLFRDAALWKHNFRIGAAYMAAGEGASFNIGEVSLQGTRHADILKLWKILQHLGKDGCASIIDHNFAITDAILSKISERSDILRLAVSEPETNIICFRSESVSVKRDQQDEWNAKLQKYLLDEADCFVALPLYEGQRRLKVVLLNLFTAEGNVKALFDKIDEFHMINA